MIEYVAASGQTDESHVDGFVRVYQQAFAGKPYEESYAYEQVIEEIWQPHLLDGITVLALDEPGEVVGFGCAIPTTKAPTDVQEYIEKHGESAGLTFDLDTSWYMSELGVAESHRLKGIGSQLVKWRLKEIKSYGVDHYIFRTAAAGSNSIHLYQKIGASLMPELQSMRGTDQVELNDSKSTERVYLFGDCDTALANLSD